MSEARVSNFTKGAMYSPQTITDIGGRYAPIANLIRLTGEAAYNTLYGVQREIQYFAADEVNRFWYTIHDNDVEALPQTIITRYPMDGVGLDRVQEAVSEPSSEFGHQGIGLELLANNATKLWCTDRTNQLAAIRFDFVAGGGAVNKEQYVLFKAQDGFNAGVSCFDGLSLGGKYVIAHAKKVGVNTVLCRMWDLSEMLLAGPGDHSSTYVYEIDVSVLYTSSTYPVQGLASDNNAVFGVSGGNGFAVGARRMSKHMVSDGMLMEFNSSVMVGSVEALEDGTGISYEPEGLQFVHVNGVPRLCLGVRSGSSLTPSIFRVHAIGVTTDLDLNINASGVISRFRRLGTQIGSIFVNSAAFCFRATGPTVNLRLGTNDVDQWEIEAAQGGFRPVNTLTQRIGQSARSMLEVWSKFFMLKSGVGVTWNAGSPEGVVAMSPGSICVDTVNGQIYVKKTGVAESGWKLVTQAV